MPYGKIEIVLISFAELDSMLFAMFKLKANFIICISPANTTIYSPHNPHLYNSAGKTISTDVVTVLVNINKNTFYCRSLSVVSFALASDVLFRFCEFCKKLFVQRL